VTVEVKGVVLPFSALNALMFPTPEDERPMDGVLFVQVYEVPVPVKITAEVLLPLQIT
jgi:hypothetical protein